MSSDAPHNVGEPGAEYFLELIIDTLGQLTPDEQGFFLQKFLKSLSGVGVSEEESLVHWRGILRRRSELAERLGRAMTLRTAAADYFDTAKIAHNTTLVDYEELKHLRHNAATDPLTGLYNRRLFQEYMTKELTRSRRHGDTLSLLLFDLRNFKQVNDSRGHATGDAVLRNLARACQETIRESDYSFRVGGDEFAVLLPQSQSENADALAQRIKAKFERYARTSVPDLELGLDYGVASFPSDGDSLEKLYQVADGGLYAQKEKGHAREVELTAGPALSPLLVVPGRTPVVREVPQPSRRHEVRISMEGLDARGVLHNGFGDREVKLLDFSRRGIGFLLDEGLDLPEIFNARLHVPPFADVDRRFRRVYMQPIPEGLTRVGCCLAN